MKRVFRLTPALKWLLRPVLGIGLGLAFFYAGVQKYLAPYEFAEAILAYQLLPEVLVGLTATIFPPLEMAVGGLLVLGYLAEAWGRLARSRRRIFGDFLPGGMFRRTSLLLIILQLGVFILVLVITMARGLKIDCGCGLFMDRQVGLGAIVEDLFLSGLTAWLYWMESKVILEGKTVFA